MSMQELDRLLISFLQAIKLLPVPAHSLRLPLIVKDS